MRNTVRKSILGLAVLGALLAGAQPAGATGDGQRPKRCAASFDVAQRVDMESFRDFDAATWRASHDPSAVSITASGARFAGIDAIMTATRGHFTNREAIWSWTEVNRQVYGCSTAFIEYVAVYEIPRLGIYQRAHIVVTYIHRGGHWKSILDQGTLLELRTTPPA